MDCVFCGIVAGKIASSKVFEDDVAVAIMDINPVTAGHVLVIPKRHFVGLSDMDEATGAHLMTVAMRVQSAIRLSSVRCEGINLFLADGAAAFQEVFHAHLHVFPRYEGDSFKIAANWSHKPAREELDEVASRLRTAYNELRPDGM
jgi:histidine triad (HIT) family protein